jgi:hypothetical protein
MILVLIEKGDITNLGAAKRNAKTENRWVIYLVLRLYFWARLSFC